ncbi:MAG: toprim domain-containing protein, partial [Polyangiaceae bacterium]|nr:toprim domain-containing protein [Polyangiaceae bacterium]
MARIPEAEIEWLKAEVSVERLAEARGIALKRHGGNLLGLCPFHDDREPSLVITPDKNLWHCLGACQTGGSVIDWVMRAEGVSFRCAVELLRADLPSLAAVPSERRGRQAGPVAKKSTTVKLPTLAEATTDEAVLMRQVADYYHATLKESPEALGYLEKRGLRSAELVERFRLGFANRTLAYRLPQKNRQAGAELRGRLQRLGILRESGHEHFNGSVVVPIFDGEGRVVELYGRKVTPNLRAGTPLHLYLPGPHRGVWNEATLAASKTVIVCEALLDAMTFWCAGHRNVTAAYGVEGFTEDHYAALERHGVEQVLIAYDRDEAGDRAAEKLAMRLGERGVESFRVQFPRGMDANEYALKMTPASKAFELVLRQAQWLGKGRAKPTLALPAGMSDALVSVPAAVTSESAPMSDAESSAPSPASVPAPALVVDEDGVVLEEPAAHEELDALAGIASVATSVSDAECIPSLVAESEAPRAER